jgi:F-type H+-transporting ATPase subunit b
MMRLNYLLATLVLLANPVFCLAAEEGGEGHGGIGGDLAFWSLVTFVGFIWVIRKLGWQGFVDGLSERERLENEAIARAEGKNRDAQQHLTDRKGELEAIDETTREFIEEAHRDAERTRTDIVAAARSEAEKIS